MEEHQKRVKLEKEELDIKIKKLDDFLNKDSVIVNERIELNRLINQLFVMKLYSDILDSRIKSWEDKNEILWN